MKPPHENEAANDAQTITSPGGCAAAACSACGGSGLGKSMYNPEIDKTQRDRCYACKGTGTKPSYADRESAYESIARIARDNRLIVAAAGGVLVIGHPDEMAKQYGSSGLAPDAESKPNAAVVATAAPDAQPD